jgi:toxin ParE1/3/4
MSLLIIRGEHFLADIDHRVRYYLREANPAVAWKFEAALDATLLRISENPALGRVRHFRNPLLHDLRSICVNKPFERILLFYKFDSTTLQSVRLIHGARNLPRRLLEPND